MDTRKHRPTYKSTKKKFWNPSIAYTFANCLHLCRHLFLRCRQSLFLEYTKTPYLLPVILFFSFLKLINIYIIVTPLHLLGKTTKNLDIFSNFKFHRKPLFEMSMWRCDRCRGVGNDTIMVRSFFTRCRIDSINEN